MVKYDELAFDRTQRRSQICNRPHDFHCVHVTTMTCISSHDENSWMETTRVDDKVVQVLEIVMIVTEKHPLLSNRMQQMDWIIVAMTPRIAGDLNVVASLTQAHNEKSCARVVVQI